MKKLTVFISNSKSGAFFQIANGWKNALAAAGHNAVMWDGDIATWATHKPDIFIGCSGWRHNVPRPRGNTRVAIHVNPYCSQQLQVPGGPLINENASARDWVISQKPDVVFGYGLQDDMERWWSGWALHGFRLLGMPNAADVTIYKPGPVDPALVCDIGWVGGYWPYKAINLDQYLLPVAKKYKTMWYGWSGPANLWRGQAEAGQVVRLFNSARVCPAVVEPHTTLYGIDIPERIFKIAACGALTVSDPFWGFERYFNPKSIPMAKNPQDYADIVASHLSATDEARRTRALELRQEVLAKHTYHHRVQSLLAALGFTVEAAEYNALIKVLK